MLLQRALVPHYWVHSPEDRLLIAYAPGAGSYRICFAVEHRHAEPVATARTPFEWIDIDLRYVSDLEAHVSAAAIPNGSSWNPGAWPLES
jgi:hypothetical protein